MYLKHFGLQQKPFSLEPNPEFLYLSRSHADALTMLEYALMEQDGAAVLSGEIGCGKTTLINYLLAQLDGNYSAAFINNTLDANHNIWRSVNYAFGLNYDASDHLTLYGYLVEHAKHEARRGRRLLLIIDEAQNLEPTNIEKLRMLADPQPGEQACVQLLLVGQPELQNLLATPQMRALSQRILVEYHLTALSYEELNDYIAARLNYAGCERELFSESAREVIYNYSKGVPRLINKVCDRALVYAYVENLSQVDASLVHKSLESMPGGRSAAPIIDMAAMAVSSA